jgi:hypothetical protein
MALGPAHSPVQWALGDLSWGGSDLGMEFRTHPAWLLKLSMSSAVPVLIHGASHGMSQGDIYLYKYWFSLIYFAHSHILQRFAFINLIRIEQSTQMVLMRIQLLLLCFCGVYP